MKITPVLRFRSGRNTYESGQEYDVDRDDGVFYVRSGWATSPDYSGPVTGTPEAVELKPKSTIQGQRAKRRK